MLRCSWRMVLRTSLRLSLRTSSRTALQASLWARHSPLTLYRTDVGYFNASRRRLLLQRSRLRRWLGLVTKQISTGETAASWARYPGPRQPATPCGCTASRDVGDGPTSDIRNLDSPPIRTD